VSGRVPSRGARLGAALATVQAEVGELVDSTSVLVEESSATCG
jgi:hypothetical protein